MWISAVRCYGNPVKSNRSLSQLCLKCNLYARIPPLPRTIGTLNWVRAGFLCMIWERTRNLKFLYTIRENLSHSAESLESTHGCGYCRTNATKYRISQGSIFVLILLIMKYSPRKYPKNATKSIWMCWDNRPGLLCAGCYAKGDKIPIITWRYACRNNKECIVSSLGICVDWHICSSVLVVNIFAVSITRMLWSKALI